MSGDAKALEATRSALLEAVGPEGLIDAAAVVGNFERMVRIADATGIPLDTPMNAMTADIRAELGIDGFASSANTEPASALAKALGRLLRPVLPRLLRLFSRATSA